MDIGSILLGIALLLLVTFIVVRPIVDGRAERAREPGPGEALLFERERVLAALRDLDFDHATGKLLDEDYAAQRAVLVAQGAAVLRQLDALGLAPAAPGADPDAEIEQAVARLRGRAPSAPGAAPEAVDPAVAGACPQCGAPAQPGAQFCAQCGAPLALTCAHCGRTARPGDQFCAGCGQPLASANGGLRQAKVSG